MISPEKIKELIQSGEIRFSASRGSGPGGQNVNKVNTKVELRFNIRETLVFNSEEKERIETRLKNRINLEGELLIVSQSERTQAGNKAKAEERLFSLIEDALRIRKPRKAGSPTYASKIERLRRKKFRSVIKSSRRKETNSGD